LIDWVQRNGGSVQGVGVANLAGSDGGSGWGLMATQVRGYPVLKLP
jgi:histone-lysine N-methyltransferase SETD3